MRIEGLKAQKLSNEIKCDQGQEYKKLDKCITSQVRAQWHYFLNFFSITQNRNKQNMIERLLNLQ